LFTEDHVRRLVQKIESMPQGSEPCPWHAEWPAPDCKRCAPWFSPAAAPDLAATVRAILSALAEDGRLGSAGGFELATLGGRYRYTLWLHRCGHVEGWDVAWKPADGGCDACESGSDNPADWQPLYRAVPAESGGALPSDRPALAGRPTMPDES
jgi:hypothetical protein